jgi:phosphomannomutase
MNTISNIRFGTDGWRGLVDTEVNLKSIGRLAQAYADYLHSIGNHRIKVAIGYDGRKNSKQFARLFARILSGNNIVVFLSDKTGPTPVVSYHIISEKLSGGVMITASHNPSNYNGVKLKGPYGGSLLNSATKEIESMIGHNLVQASDDNIYQVDLRNGYLAHLESLIDFESIKKANLKIAIDSMSGAGQQIIENILFKHGIRSKTIFKMAEEDFSERIADPTAQNLVPLYNELTTEKNYSIGVATDGDADRAAFLLETGEFLNSQETILLLADYLINQRGIQGSIVKTSSVTDKLYTLFGSSVNRIFDVQVGFKNITEKMITENIAFGCEESGGYSSKIHMPDRDGIFSALMFLEMLAKSGYTRLSDYVNKKRETFGRIFYRRKDAPLSQPGIHKRLYDLFTNPPDEISGFKIVSFKEFYLDKEVLNGIKFTLEGNNKWLLLRASDTEPIIRAYAEAETNEELDKILSSGEEIIGSMNQ